MAARAEPVEELRAHDRRAQNVSQHLQDPELALSERTCLPRRDLQHAGHRVAVPERDDDHGTRAHLPGRFAVDTSVGLRIVTEHDLPTRDAETGQARGDLQAQAEVGLARARNRSVHHLVSFDHLHDGAVGKRQPARLGDDLAHDGIQVEVARRDRVLRCDDLCEEGHLGELVLHLPGYRPDSTAGCSPGCGTTLDPHKVTGHLGVARGVSAGNRIGLEGGRMTKIWGLSKPDAEYGPAPTPDVRCDKCKYMFPPLALGGCRLVRGVISGSSSCKEFVPRHRAPTDTEI